MEKKPVVSIIIPVYNGANYLSKAIDSALEQTYPFIEVLVVNDGSTDDHASRDIALGYGDRIRYFEKINGGVSSALNYGIRHMHGDYFIWLSHDDLLSPERVETDMRLLGPGKADITYCRRALVDENGEVYQQFDYAIKQPVGLMDAWNLLATMSICCMTIAKACFEKTGLFDEENRMTQDVAMCLLLGKHYAFRYNPDSVFYSREHRERGTHVNQAKHQKSLLQVSACLRNHTTFADFFPGKQPENADSYKYWITLGNLYEFLGDEEMADRSYKNSMAIRQNIPGRAKVFIELVNSWRMLVPLKKIKRLFGLSAQFLGFTLGGTKYFRPL